MQGLLNREALVISIGKDRDGDRGGGSDGDICLFSVSPFPFTLYSFLFVRSLIFPIFTSCAESQASSH